MAQHCKSACVHAQLYLTLCDPMYKPARLFCPWDCPGKNTGVDCCAVLQGNLSGPGIEPMSLASPALAGGFFTTTILYHYHHLASVGNQLYFNKIK